MEMRPAVEGLSAEDRQRKKKAKVADASERVLKAGGATTGSTNSPVSKLQVTAYLRGSFAPSPRGSKRL
jgi:hypothetical protein